MSHCEDCGKELTEMAEIETNTCDECAHKFFDDFFDDKDSDEPRQEEK